MHANEVCLALFRLVCSHQLDLGRFDLAAEAVDYRAKYCGPDEQIFDPEPVFKLSLFCSPLTNVEGLCIKPALTDVDDRAHDKNHENCHPRRKEVTVVECVEFDISHEHVHEEEPGKKYLSI